MMTLRYDKPSSGFTLLEVMIAISILATTFVTLLGTQAKTISLATEAAFQLEAPLLASAKLADYQSNLKEITNDSGTFEIAPTYRWDLVVEDYQLTDIVIGNNSNGLLKKIELTISLAKSNYTHTLTYYHYLHVNSDS